MRCTPLVCQGIQIISTCLGSPSRLRCLLVVWAIPVLPRRVLVCPVLSSLCEDKARKCQHTEDKHQVQLGHVTTACTEDERDCAGTSSKDKYISKCTRALLARKEICKNCL